MVIFQTIATSFCAFRNVSSTQGPLHCWMSSPAPMLLRVWLLQDNGWSISNMFHEFKTFSMFKLFNEFKTSYFGLVWPLQDYALSMLNLKVVLEYLGQADWEEGYIRDCNGKSNGGSLDTGIGDMENMAGVHRRFICKCIKMLRTSTHVQWILSM